MNILLKNQDYIQIMKQIMKRKIAEKVIEREISKANKNPDAYNIDELNTMMDGLINSGDLFPLSLKKAPKEVKLQAVNFTDKIKADILRNIVYKD